MLKAGAKILVPHPSEGFVGATVESAGAEIKCQADDGERLTVDAKKVAESDEKAFEGVADLTSLDVLSTHDGAPSRRAPRRRGTRGRRA